MDQQATWEALQPADRDQHSRSFTTLAALQRLGFLNDKEPCGPSPQGISQPEPSTTAGPRRDSLMLHFVGASPREEGGSLAETCIIFAELVARLSSDHGITQMWLLLVGPAYTNPGPWTATAQGEVLSTVRGGCTITARHIPGLYHEVPLEGLWAEPDAVVAFQPGIWGYDSWEPTARQALHSFGAPFVLTSYNDSEAADDSESLEEMGYSSVSWAAPGWAAQVNPFSATSCRASVNNEGRELREQHWWQCLVPASQVR